LKAGEKITAAADDVEITIDTGIYQERIDLSDTPLIPEVHHLELDLAQLIDEVSVHKDSPNEFLQRAARDCLLSIRFVKESLAIGQPEAAAQWAISVGRLSERIFAITEGEPAALKGKRQAIRAAANAPRLSAEEIQKRVQAVKDSLTEQIRTKGKAKQEAAYKEAADKFGIGHVQMKKIYLDYMKRG
jgi:hypothetical protein